MPEFGWHDLILNSRSRAPGAPGAHGIQVPDDSDDDGDRDGDSDRDLCLASQESV